MTTPPKPLSPPAEAVARLHATGLTVRQIAAALEISTQGVRYHLHRLGLTANRESRVAS